MRFRAPLLMLAALAGLQAQPPVMPPPEVYRAFLQGDLIVSGTVAEVTPAGSPDRGTFRFTVREQLRGKPVPGELTLSYEIFPPDPRRPPVLWQRVRPAAGKNLVLFLAPEGDKFRVDGVLDLGGDDAKALPLIRQSLQLEDAAGKKDKQPLLNATGDPSPFVRGVALTFLISKVCPNDAACRTEMLDRMAAIARNPTEKREQRVWAVDTIATKVYFGFRNGDEVDRKAAMALAGLMADPDPAVRGEAIQFLHGYILGQGTVKPDLSGNLPGRRAIVEQLRRDAESNLPFAAQARDLAPIVAQGQ